MVIPTQAPRQKKCRICTLIQMPEVVTTLLFDNQLNWMPLDAAIEYQREVGLTATERQLEANAKAHRKHVTQWMESGGGIAPAHSSNGDSGMTRIPPPMGDTNWLDASQQGMNIGVRAIAELDTKLTQGVLAPSELVSIAKMGQTAASTRAALEIKGAIKRMEAITALASGFKKPKE